MFSIFSRGTKLAGEEAVLLSQICALPDLAPPSLTALKDAFCLCKTSNLNSGPENKSYYYLPVIIHCGNIAHKKVIIKTQRKAPFPSTSFLLAPLLSRALGINSFYDPVGGATQKQEGTDDCP